MPLRLLACCIAIILLSTNMLVAQTPIAGFGVSSTVCINETNFIYNTSSNSTSYVWDFCHEDLISSPSVFLQTTMPTVGTFFYHSLKIVNDNGEWIGFCTDMNGNKLYRLEFGNNLSNSPTIINLGTLSGFSSPAAIELIKAADAWYAFITNLFGNTLIRVRFGNGLKTTPTSSDNLGNISGQFSNPSGVKMIFLGGKYYAYITNLSSNTVCTIDFGNSPQNAPVSSKLIGQTSLASSSPYGISLITQNGFLYGLVGSFDKTKTFKLDFGTDPFSDPTFTQINGIPNGADLEFALEGQKKYYALVRSRTDGIYRIDFGTDLSATSPAVTRLGPLGVLTSEARNISVVRDSPNWKAFTVSSTGSFYNLNFLGNCDSQVSINTSLSATPSNLFYKLSGDYFIELTAFSAQNLMSVASATISVLNKSASGVSIIQSSEKCVDNSISFNANSIATLMSYDWNFGDGTSSTTGPSEQHQYSSAGDYLVSLTAIEQNGCTNNATEPISIFNKPVANFSAPTITGKSCTLQDYLFTNQSTFDPLSNPSWTWAVNAIDQASTQNFNHTFSLPDTYSISLTSEIPGCSSTISKNFLVEASGTLVDFSFTDQCEGDLTLFTNNSVGTADFTWNFGDGQTSTQNNPSHVFPDKGVYNVLLSASDTNGCLNSKTLPVAIISTPAPDFFIDLPPFSCSGTPTQFHDNTPPLTDSNITNWDWAFNDGTGATSTQKDPLHTFALPGIYNVDLQVTSNFGCSATVQLPVDIAISPNANFSVGASCLNKPTQFENTSSSGIQSWLWIIGSSTYAFPNPVHTFASSGSYPVSLTVTGLNACEAMSIKTVEVKPVPSLNFSYTPPCTNLPTIFTDNTTGVDLPTSWFWDFGNGNTATGSPASNIFSSAGAFPVKMKVNTESGCEYSLSKNVVVAPSPIASFTESTSFGPPPLLVQFTNTSTGSSSVLWEFNDPLNTTSTDQNPFFTFLDLGDYLVQLTASNNLGCSDTFSKTIQVLISEIDLSLEELSTQENSSGSAFSPVITVKNNSNVNISGFDVFVSGSSGLKIKTNILLSLVPGASSELIVPVELYSRENYLCVEVSALNDAVASNNSLCINLSTEPVIISPYPNPTSGKIYFDAVMDAENSGTLRVANSMGQIIFRQTFPALTSGMNRIELDLSGNNAGLYVAIWEMAGKQHEFRFVLR